MKKLLLSFLPALFASLFFVPGLNADHMSFTEGLANLDSVEDSKTFASIYGRAEVDDEIDHLSIAYRFNMNSTNDIDGANDNNFSRLGLYVKVFNHNAPNDAIPFKELIFQLNGEVTLIGIYDLYFRLNDVSITLDQADELMTADAQDFKNMLKPFQNTWYHINLAQLDQTTYGQDVPAEVYQEWESELEGDPRDLIMSSFEYAYRSQTSAFLTEEQIQTNLEAFASVFESQFFNVRQVISGPNTGFDFYYLNRVKLANWIEDIAVKMGNPMPEADIIQMREDLGKITLSGIYRVDQASGLLDNFLVRFKLREVSELNSLEFNYRVKLADPNKNNVVSAPVTFIEFETAMESQM